MKTFSRQMVWIKTSRIVAWGCSECAWVFNTAGPPVGESIDEMKSHYEQRRDKEFTSHVCAEHPKAKSPKR